MGKLVQTIVFAIVFLLAGCAINLDRIGFRAERHFDAMNHAQEDIRRIAEYRVKF